MTPTERLVLKGLHALLLRAMPEGAKKTACVSEEIGDALREPEVAPDAEQRPADSEVWSVVQGCLPLPGVVVKLKSGPSATPIPGCYRQNLAGNAVDWIDQDGNCIQFDNTRARLYYRVATEWKALSNTWPSQGTWVHLFGHGNAKFCQHAYRIPHANRIWFNTEGRSAIFEVTPTHWKPATVLEVPCTATASSVEQFTFAMGVLSKLGITTLTIPVDVQPNLTLFLTQAPGGERFKDTDWSRPFRINGVEIRLECAAVPYPTPQNYPPPERVWRKPILYPPETGKCVLGWYATRSGYCRVLLLATSGSYQDAWTTEKVEAPDLWTEAPCSK